MQGQKKETEKHACQSNTTDVDMVIIIKAIARAVHSLLIF
jgi:hypothetical protein